MKPISFTCHAHMSHAPELISVQILDLTKWPEFLGYGPIPGIKSAEFEVRTPEVVGTRIRVKNLDGSGHVEEITEWKPCERISLRFSDFAPPLSRMASGFVETWEFDREAEVTRVKRSMALYPKTLWAWPILWMISFLLKCAIAKHLRQIASER
jgi:hypothetical protein